MKTRLIAITRLVAILALPLALYAQETDPAAVVTAAYEAWNAGDVDAYLALMADDAVVDMPSFGTHTGLEEIRAWMEGLLPLNPQMEFEILQVEGDAVTLKSWYTDDDFRALGIVLEAAEVIVVQDGRIASDTWTVTDESMAELQAAMAALPQSGGHPFPSRFAHGAWWCGDLGRPWLGVATPPFASTAVVQAVALDVDQQVHEASG